MVGKGLVSKAAARIKRVTVPLAGTKREHGKGHFGSQSEAAPATVVGKPTAEKPLGNREGILMIMIRKPGDLPVQYHHEYLREIGRKKNDSSKK